MMALLVFREKLMRFYSRYDMYVMPVLRFFLSLAALYFLSENVGFRTSLNRPPVLAGLSLLCAFLPFGASALLAGGVMLLHISSVSLEMTLVMGMFLLAVWILYYGLQPGDSCLLLLTPLFFHLNIPYAVPLLAGLSGSAVTAVPVCVGTCVYYLLQYVKQNAGALTNDASLDIIQKYTQIVDSIASNNAMLVMAAACAAGVFVVYGIRRLSVDYAWTIAIAAGTVAQLLVIFVGDFLFDVSVPIGQLLAGALVSMILAGIYNFLFFSVDYSRTEYTQFEDDDYYYYVKAVPKITVSAPDVKVQKISSTRNRRTVREKD